jgi:twitching motility protein PilT
MRDGKLEGMQDFDSVIKNMIERGVVSLEDGLAFATNQNNLLLALKGLTSSDDFIRAQDDTFVPEQPGLTSSVISLSD